MLDANPFKNNHFSLGLETIFYLWNSTRVFLCPKKPKIPQNHKQHPPKADRNRQKTPPPPEKPSENRSVQLCKFDGVRPTYYKGGYNNNAFWWGRRGTEGIIFSVSVILWESQGGEVEKLQGGDPPMGREEENTMRRALLDGGGVFSGWNSGPNKKRIFSWENSCCCVLQPS